MFFYTGHIYDFRCKIPTEHISNNYNPEEIDNATIIQQQCDVIIKINQSGKVLEEKVPCRHGYEFSGPETTASEVIVVNNLKKTNKCLQFSFWF